MTTLFTAKSLHRVSDAECERGRIHVLFVAIVTSALSGCQGDEPIIPPPTNTSMLRGIVTVYAMATRDLGRPPKNVEELKAVYAEADPDTDKYVRSSRDGEEFVIAWGQRFESLPRDTVVAYERKGVGGKRMVVTAGSVVREVTEEEFAKLKFPKGHTPET